MTQGVDGPKASATPKGLDTPPRGWALGEACGLWRALWVGGWGSGWVGGFEGLRMALGSFGVWIRVWVWMLVWVFCNFIFMFIYFGYLGFWNFGNWNFNFSSKKVNRVFGWVGACRCPSPRHRVGAYRDRTVAFRRRIA